ncbi:hypothetical protein [Alkalicoccobacillus porphyridii]|uniref:Uncharacterized protein n=1 Tax=Alkalicoccobacillus porphyridii TaxID=2597270 RepID=A0A554A497_9BACI|nr:hypothetical protein [Alkalicoccobacillus porphyridii]TSB48508.1 hypothetical protein FN960_02850 [Alkalicoccobacillus porphyridii]
MDSSLQIASLNQRISSKQSSVNSLSYQNQSLHIQYQDGITELGRLERELEELLHTQQGLVGQLDNIEALTLGEGSPMARIKFYSPGVLEGRALQRIQERVVIRQEQQLQGRNTIQAAIEQAEDQASELEGRIAEQRAVNYNLETTISNNQNRINQLRTQIASDRSRLRML